MKPNRALSAPAAPQTVKLSDIVDGEGFRVRRRLNPSTVAQYRQAYSLGVSLPPLRLGIVSGALVLVDGGHRLAALRALGQTEAEAVAEPMTEAEARWQSGQCNLAHGLPLSRAEKREAFRAYVKAGRHKAAPCRFKTYRAMAEELAGISSVSGIRVWMREDFPRVFRAMGGEADEAPGGLRGAHPEETLAAVAEEHLANAAAAMKGIRRPALRGRVLDRWDGARAEAADAAPWTREDEITF